MSPHRLFVIFNKCLSIVFNMFFCLAVGLAFPLQLVVEGVDIVVVVDWDKFELEDMLAVASYIADSAVDYLI